MLSNCRWMKRVEQSYRDKHIGGKLLGCVVFPRSAVGSDQVTIAVVIIVTLRDGTDSGPTRAHRGIKEKVLVQ